MSNHIVLTVITGPHRNERYVFDQQTRCLAGRASDCQIRLNGDARDLQISRRHCVLEINPPQVRVRDLGSRNGTFINGQKVSPCDHCVHGEQPDAGCAGALLQNGDVLTIGGSSFWVTIKAATEAEVETC
jgi:eukaryotic-like serine/threonine-protein kinase